MSTFAQALKERPAPRQLGDVSLRYEDALLVGETRRPVSGWRAQASWVVAVAAALVATVLLPLGAPVASVAFFLALAAAGLGAAVWLRAVDGRRRRFVLNFRVNSLRLDFSTAFVGRPRTMVVDFDSVREVALMEQAGGSKCLTVDFVPAPGSSELLREALAAFIPDSQVAEAERLERVLRGAFGLGAVPEDSPLRVSADGGPTEDKWESGAAPEQRDGN